MRPVPPLNIDDTLRGRLRLFVRAQLPFALGLACVVVAIAVASPDSLMDPVVLGGIAVALVATSAALLVPWERIPKSWTIVIAALDIVTVALVRAEILPVLPGATMLAIYPMLWAAYSFEWWGVALAVFGSALIVGLRFVYAGAAPQDAVAWTNAVMVPLAIVGLSVIAVVAARELRRYVQRLAEAHDAQTAALHEARDAESLVVGILETVDASVAFYDREGRVTVANAMARLMSQKLGFRLDATPYAGPGVFAADRTTPVPNDEQLIPRALRGEVIRSNLAWVGPPEAQVALLGSASPVRRQDGSVQGTVVVVLDVTELAEAIEVREEFLRTVAHELRTPLAGVTGFLALIEDAIDPADAKLHGYIEVVTRRTDDLMQRLADLTAATTCNEPIRLDDIDVRAVITAASCRVAALADASANTIEIAAAGAARALADPAKLEMVITELLTNAVKFGQPGRPITVSLADADDRVVIAVSHEGPGLTEAERRRVFDRFYRTPSARSRAIQGFGLGLTNVRAILLAHGGGIRIDSAPGQRTTFTIDLPVPDTAASSDTADLSDAARP